MNLCLKLLVVDHFIVQKSAKLESTSKYQHEARIPLMTNP